MSRISQTTINEIQSLSLSGSISQYIDLEKKGPIWRGISPFSEEKTPSFTVSDGKGIWKCFSSGQGGSDLISFLMAKENLDYPTAINKAAKQFNIIIQYDEETHEAKEKREHSEVLKAIVSKANTSYRKNFKRLPIDHWAKKYMTEIRGFSDDILDAFNIGYAYNESHLTPIFKNEGSLTDAIELGIILKDKENEVRHFDFFRDRVIFPIYDHRTICVGFGGRINPDKADKAAKYLNSSDSIIYHKENILYGFTHAREGIIKFGYALLVEGYTDVMRMHQVGFDNAVASCGTSLTINQIKTLKKLTDRVVIFRDNDDAGQKAAKRDFELLLKNGFIVDIVAAENKTDDPDSIGQKFQEKTIDYVTSLIQDAILYSVKTAYDKYYNIAVEEWEKYVEDYTVIHGKPPKNKKINISAYHKNDLINLIVDVISDINNPIIHDQYIEEISARFPVSKSDIKKSIKTTEDATKGRIKFLNYQSEEDMYKLPDHLEIELDQVIDDIRTYGLFQWENEIYVRIGSDAPFYFKNISNFSIEIVQHMQDEKFPMKLIRICNVHGIEKIFDVVSDRINTLQSFKNVVTSYGNFFFSGSAADHENLLKFLFDKMGNGRKIDILGWQPEGFWVWNNKVIIPGINEESLNKEGLFKHKGESYYIPSANKNYEKNMFAYGPQKKFKSIETEISTANYFHQVYKVHREHAITGILFGVASLFQDIVVNYTGFFPILFYFGPASTGKDNLGEAIQSLLGIPQTAIQLEGGASTIKAQIREFSQFNNGISQLSEYKRGNPQLDGVLKGLWDRRGYKRGSLESRVATDEIPILSSTILTGNDYPDAEALITRCLWEEMKVQEFDDSAKDNYNKLKDIIKKGVSGISDFFINKRHYFEELFLESYRANVNLLNDLDQFKDTTSRIISNLSVLLSVYHLFEKENFFPFKQSEIIAHFAKMVDNQKRKLASASPFIKFWDCFIMCMRGNVNDRLIVNQDLRLDGAILSFTFKTAFMKIQRMWLSQYNEAAPDQRKMKEILMEDTSFIVKDKKILIDKDGTPTSAIQFDLSKIESIKSEIVHNINVQLNKGTLFSDENEDNKKGETITNDSLFDDNDDDDVPF